MPHHSVSFRQAYYIESPEVDSGIGDGELLYHLDSRTVPHVSIPSK